MAENRDIWIFSEKADLRCELIAGAQPLAEASGGKVTAIVLGPREDAQEAAAAGAHTVLWLGDPNPGFLVEDCVPALARLVSEQKPFALLVGATVRGKAIAGRLAARLNTTVITDARHIRYQNGSLEVRHMIFGGGAERLERAIRQPALITVGPGVFTAAEKPANPAGEIREVKTLPTEGQVTVQERRPRAISKVNLAAARRVVCAGRGVAQVDDLKLVNTLAEALSAELACTRPLAEGLDWLPRERYIGISGASIHPDLYLGIGVSGQVQHIIGMAASRVVVAVNKDPNAPIFQQADYGIAADLYQFVPALIEALRGH